jgi:hypothetical protein
VFNVQVSQGQFRGHHNCFEERGFWLSGERDVAKPSGPVADECSEDEKPSNRSDDSTVSPFLPGQASPWRHSGRNAANIP